MKRRIWGGLAVVAVVVSPLLTVCGLRWIHVDLLPPAWELCRLPGPVLAASAADGEVILSWKLADGRQPMVRGWQYLQSVQGESSLVTPDIGPQAASYAVSDLMNGVTYSFQIRAIHKSDGFGCWSASVPAKPGHLGELVKRMEKRQEAIAGHTSAIVKGMAANRKILQELGERGIATLGEVAVSTSDIAVQTEGIRGEVEQLADSVDAAGQKIAAGLAGIPVQQCEKGQGEQSNCTVTSVRPGFCEPLESCGPPDLCDRTLLGKVRFGHNSHRIGDDESNEEGNRKTFNEIIAKLQAHGGGLVLTEGYASAVGHARHNLHLSDMRAACVSRCLHDRLASLWLEDGNFEFREIARGEVSGVNDLAGANEENQRVDITFCPGYSNPDPGAKKRPPVWPTDCACPSDSQPI